MTVVLQSFRSHDVPEWIQRCMHSVRAWAEASQFDYKFVGDELLALPPEWFRAKAGRYRTVITDLARLLCMRECLLQESERVIWVDADVLVFQPASLHIDLGLSYGYAREVWFEKERTGWINASLKINNSACLFQGDATGRAHLDKYIDDCLSIVEHAPRIRDHTLIGTRYLTTQNSQAGLPVLEGFGLLCPIVMRAIAEQDGKVLREFAEQQAAPVYAANLCNFFRASGPDRRGIADGAYSAVVETLIQTAGRCLNARANIGT